MPRQRPQSGPGGVVRLASLLSSNPGRGRGRHSPLTRWLLAHHDEFAAMLRERQPGWGDVALALAAMGLRDGAQEPPNGERVRKAWWHARQAMLARRAGRGAKPMVAQGLTMQAAADGVPLAPVSSLAAAGERSAPVQTPAQAVAPDALPAGVRAAVQPARPRPRLDIRPATRLSGLPAEASTPTAPIGLVASVGPAVPAGLPLQTTDATRTVAGGQLNDDQVAEALRQAIGQMQASKIPLPKVVS